ncbi:AzlC family ABC transporter permease [Xanthobacter sp. VNH20]|uniref:AzlC family ABC transporter permease n=1 Tax=Xanthobacter sp. VNH20 TaxID=3156616 RepID=UPI0032B35747
MPPSFPAPAEPPPQPPDLVPALHRTTLGWAGHGARHAISVPGVVLFAGYVGLGGLLHGVGFPFFAGMLSTLLIWALPAQVILAGGIGAGTALPALALAIGLSSLRLLPMTVAIAPFMRGHRRSFWAELLCSHYVAMTFWVEGLRLLPKVPGEGRVAFALGLGNALLAISLAGTAAGFFLAGELPPALAAGLLFLTPVSFSLMMIRNAGRDLMDWLALGAGLLSVPFVVGLAGGADLMISGIGGGTVAYLIGRFLRRRG